jgi:LPXTG-site transpeptidase (sortase) family protein
MQQRWVILAATGVVALVAGGTVALLGHRGPAYQPHSLPVAAPSVTLPAPSPKASPAVQSISRAVPVRVIIPAIGVNAPVLSEGTDATGALEVPPLSGPQASDVGWWDGGSAPGQDGPAVLAGHIDSAAAGHLVFWNLHKLVAGDSVETVLANGSTVSFKVTALQEVSKNNFPTQQVYGPTSGPALRLITCGGSFDSASGHYQDNLIVYAVAA